MKKFLCVLVTACLFFVMVGCKEEHSHTYAETWSYDEQYHWHFATCDHIAEGVEALDKDKAHHNFDSNGVCGICSYQTVEAQNKPYKISTLAWKNIYNNLSKVKAYQFTYEMYSNDFFEGGEIHVYNNNKLQRMSDSVIEYAIYEVSGNVTLYEYSTSGWQKSSYSANADEWQDIKVILLEDLSTSVTLIDRAVFDDNKKCYIYSMNTDNEQHHWTCYFENSKLIKAIYKVKENNTTIWHRYTYDFVDIPDIVLPVA